MITEFKIFENYNEESIIDMGYSIFLYKNIFFKKTPKQKTPSTQYDLTEFFKAKGQMLVNNLMYSFSGHKLRRELRNNNNVIKDFIITLNYMDENMETKLISEISKRNLIEQMTIILEIMAGLDSDEPHEKIENFLRRSELLTALNIIKAYYEGDEFNMTLWYNPLGKTMDEIKNSIDNFYVEQEMDKYNL